MDFNKQPYLEDNLVALRPLNTKDFKLLYAVASDPLIWEQHQDKNRYTLEGFTRFFEESIRSEGALLIHSKKEGEVLGSSRYKIIDRAEQVVEIGWTFLGKKFWGGSYNGSVKKLMINHALGAAKNVVFYVNEKNVRSQRALEKLGARKMGCSKIPWVLDKKTAGITYLVDQKM